MNQEQRTKLEQVIKTNYDNITGIVVLKNGRTAYEQYFNGCAAGSSIHVASVTKSILSALIGIALDKGHLKSLDQKVLDFFPDYHPKRGEKTLQTVALRNLLTMTAPYKCKSEPYTKFFTSENWMNTALDLLGGKGRTGDFRYSPIVGTHILSGILVRATGQSVMDFAVENLFSPLGIRIGPSLTLHNREEHFAFLKAREANGWVADPQGVHTAGWGLTLSAMDMAKIGCLYSDGGMWEGRQILSPKWIEESTCEHSRWIQRQLSYGYLWWIVDEKSRCCAALGDGGNAIYVNEKEHLVTAISALFKPRAKDSIELIRNFVEPFNSEPKFPPPRSGSSFQNGFFHR